jgi:hypothetical protein
MKKIMIFTIIALALALATSACDDQPDSTTYPNPATITQDNGLAFPGKVTIKSDDTYTPAAWDAVVANVVAAFNAAYEAAPPPGKTRFSNVFGNDVGAEIVLVNNLAHNWEVRDGEFRTLYLKTASIATAGYETAVNRMNANTPEVGNAAPPQRRAFLALAREKSSYAL